MSTTLGISSAQGCVKVIEGLKITCNGILITWLKPHKIVEHNLDTIITTVAGLPTMWYYKDNGLSLLTLIHIYIYF